jgi:hypothetical protein
MDYERTTVQEQLLSNGARMNWMSNLLSLVFGCRHKQDRLSRPFTHGNQTYKVCLDCGRHVPYDAVLFRPLTRSEIKSLHV